MKQPAKTSWYARKKLAEDPDYKFRETVNFSPKRWTDEALTETWAERKARRKCA